MLAVIGRGILIMARALGSVTLIVQNTIIGAFTAKKSWKNIVYQMNEIGVNTFPVTALTALFTGFVLALQTGVSFQRVFNEPMYVGTVVGFSLVKELGPVLTALVVSGRVGAAIAAELGTMKVTEQIDALYTLGTNPIKYLAVPRFIACISMVPILTLFSDFIGIVGGFIVSVYRLKIPSSVYWDDVFSIEIEDVAHGLIKSVLFGAIIVIISCYKGFVCEGGAEGVGRATTSAVVYSMVMVLVGDYFFSNLLISFGIG
ncbi:MAG: MlaE family lipid ABC transporter permease subunit [Elusimicrobia bacterium]|nr:MlaE family lipid ABC transporter permease subunit [Elusimicrobiota bacterium]MBD3412009.1 MlaE family lipid ABC transporter permease subunit [Elusimicrobiota bacterium]